MPDTIKIFVWPDSNWETEDEIDDMDWYLTSCGKSDDYVEYNVPIELEAEDIDELIELQALPGMLPPIQEPEGFDGVMKLPIDSILVVHFPKDSETPFLTHLHGKMIINCDSMSIEILKGKK